MSDTSTGMPTPGAEDLVLTVNYHVDAPPEAVFDAWTTPAGLAAWFGPAEFVTEEVVFEGVGGVWSLVMVGPDGGRYPAHGQVIDLQRPSRIVLTDKWDVLDLDFPDATVTVDIVPHGIQTAISLHATPMPDRKILADSQAGWLESFVKLGKYVSGKD